MVQAMQMCRLGCWIANEFAPTVLFTARLFKWVGDAVWDQSSAAGAGVWGGRRPISANSFNSLPLRMT